MACRLSVDVWSKESRETATGVREVAGEAGVGWGVPGRLASEAGAQVPTGWLPTHQSPMKMLQLPGAIRSAFPQGGGAQEEPLKCLFISFGLESPSSNVTYRNKPKPQNEFYPQRCSENF